MVAQNRIQKIFLAYTAIVLISLVCSLTGSTQEDTWSLYYSGPDGTNYYYEPGSVNYTPINKRTRARGTEHHVKVLEKVVYTKPEYKVKEVKTLKEFRCSRSMVRSLKIDVAYRDGMRKFEMKINPWKYIEPESPQETLYDIVCIP